VQQLRGLGGNAWRTSHNPPESALLDVTDRLGVLVLDENRVLSTTANCAVNPVTGESGCQSVPLYTSTATSTRLPGFHGIPVETGLLALRDRTHASVAWYSLCNEGGCTDGTLLLNDTAKR
jgi:beta-galactosidase/beta-glucuronidase